MPRFTHNLLTWLVVVVVFLFGSWSVLASPPLQDLPPGHPPIDQAVPERPSAGQGLEVYMTQCASCHGERGGGDGPAAQGLSNPPASFTSPDTLDPLTPNEVLSVVKEGRADKGMPPFGTTLDPLSQWDVVTYLYDLRASGVYTQGQAVYTSSCASCHGPQGAGDGPQSSGKEPNFRRWSQWVDASLSSWLDSIRSDDVHAKALASLSDEDLVNALVYVRTLTYSSLHALTGEGVISGTVKMLTEGESADFAGLPVRLWIFRGSMQPIGVLTTTVGADNTFRFERLSTEPDALYSVGTEWQGAVFTSDLLGFSDGQKVITVTLEVAAPTEEDPGIVAEQVHWFIAPDMNTVYMGELLSISNPGDRTYIGVPIAGEENKRAVIRWPLPPGVTNLMIDGGELGDRFLLQDGVLIDTLPLPPGKDVRRLYFQFQLGVEHTRVKIVHPVGMPIKSLSVFVADRGESIKMPDKFSETGSQEINGIPYKMYMAQNFAPEDTITITLSGILTREHGTKPRLFNASKSRIVGTALSVVLALLLLGGVFYTERQRRLSRGEERKAALRAQRDALLAQIAELDEAFEAGELDEASYQAERDVLMAEAVHLSMMLDEEL